MPKAVKNKSSPDSETTLKIFGKTKRLKTTPAPKSKEKINDKPTTPKLLKNISTKDNPPVALAVIAPLTPIILPISIFCIWKKSDCTMNNDDINIIWGTCNRSYYMGAAKNLKAGMIKFGGTACG